MAKRWLPRRCHSSLLASKRTWVARLLLKLSKNIIVSEYDGLDSKLEPGEKEFIKLKEIDEVFIKSGVRNGNWYADVELLEVKPKPSED